MLKTENDVVQFIVLPKFENFIAVVLHINFKFFLQGFVKLKYPRLHVDFPVALYEG